MLGVISQQKEQLNFVLVRPDFLKNALGKTLNAIEIRQTLSMYPRGKSLFSHK